MGAHLEQTRERALRYAARADAAERRIAAALACHKRGTDLLIEAWDGPPENHAECAECGYDWDTLLDRCTSPTVAALTGGSE
jgi:Zn ribbon nucleic-acid-binding protein